MHHSLINIYPIYFAGWNWICGPKAVLFLLSICG